MSYKDKMTARNFVFFSIIFFYRLQNNKKQLKKFFLPMGTNTKKQVE